MNFSSSGKGTVTRLGSLGLISSTHCVQLLREFEAAEDTLPSRAPTITQHGQASRKRKRTLDPAAGNNSRAEKFPFRPEDISQKSPSKIAGKEDFSEYLKVVGVERMADCATLALPDISILPKHVGRAIDACSPLRTILPTSVKEILENMATHNRFIKQFLEQVTPWATFTDDADDEDINLVANVDVLGRAWAGISDSNDYDAAARQEPEADQPRHIDNIVDACTQTFETNDAATRSTLRLR
ncbi:hypothetical protein CALVIDRAFT_370919 [Calocera viscosa TUFC12733]|uniref:Uncharacterized protein n=1 Tax=Calocera viscosa (strain TUFC12733) TaxID=1330018 RepID=A0A167GVE7_CALVF|nr:hypothetical protein CALVIDRAFT_370919 [Calocera viscosa TUFC12733]